MKKFKKKAKTKIKVGIASESEANREFIQAWKRAEQGKIKSSEEKLYFLEAGTLLRVLSNQRLALLHALHQERGLSIRALSKLLRRDYRNIYDDVQLLKKVGLIRQIDGQTICVPWDKIQAEINLAA